MCVYVILFVCWIVHELPHKPSVLWAKAINSVYLICVLSLWFLHLPLYLLMSFAFATTLNQYIDYDESIETSIYNLFKRREKKQIIVCENREKIRKCSQMIDWGTVLHNELNSHNLYSCVSYMPLLHYSCFHVNLKFEFIMFYDFCSGWFLIILTPAPIQSHCK